MRICLFAVKKIYIVRVSVKQFNNLITEEISHDTKKNNEVY